MVSYLFRYRKLYFTRRVENKTRRVEIKSATSLLATHRALILLSIVGTENQERSGRKQEILHVSMHQPGQRILSIAAHTVIQGGIWKILLANRSDWMCVLPASMQLLFDSCFIIHQEAIYVGKFLVNGNSHHHPWSNGHRSLFSLTIEVWWRLYIYLLTCTPSTYIPFFPCQTRWMRNTLFSAAFFWCSCYKQIMPWLVRVPYLHLSSAVFSLLISILFSHFTCPVFWIFIFVRKSDLLI